MQEERQNDEQMQDEHQNPEVNRADDDEARRRIEEEIRNVQQAIRNFDDIISQLENERTCPPRRFHQGRIHRVEERFMKCAFCEARGTHYSGSCPEVRGAEERRRVVAEKGLCNCCLEKLCGRALLCKKYHTICYHCRDVGHHSALCRLPEFSDMIRNQLQNAKEARWNCMSRLHALNRDLALFPGPA